MDFKHLYHSKQLGLTAQQFFGNSQSWQVMQDMLNTHSVAQESDSVTEFRRLCLTRLFLENVVVFSIQYFGLLISTLFSVSSILWLATGTSCAAIFMRGYSILPGIFFGSSFAYFISGVSFSLASSCAVLHMLQPCLLLYLVQRYISPSLIFHSISQLTKFIFILLILSAIFSLGLLLVCYNSIFHNTSIMEMWQTWCLADLNSILIISTVIVAWDTYYLQISELRHLKRLVILYVLLGALTIFFLSYFDRLQLKEMMLTTSAIIFILSVWDGWCAAISGVLMIAMLYHFTAFVAAQSWITDLRSNDLILLQLMLLFESMLALFICTYKNSKVRIKYETT